MLSEKPWKLVDFLMVVTLLFTLLLGGIFSSLLAALRGDAAMNAQSESVNFTISLCLYGTILALVHMMVRGRGTSWRTAFGFTPARLLSALVTALGVTFIVLPIARYLGTLSVELMDKVHLKAVPQQSVQMLQTNVSAGSRIFLGILAIVIAPVTEEVLFRGILYPFVKQRGYPKAALLGSAILFGALHLNLMTFVPLTFLGLILAWLYDTTDNLAAPIFAHSLFNFDNFLQAVLETLKWNWILIDIATFVIGGCLVGLVILFWQRPGAKITGL